MGVDWIVLGVVVLFILLDTGLIIAFIKQCEDHEMELLRDIYEECHPKKEEKKQKFSMGDVPDINIPCTDCKHHDLDKGCNDFVSCIPNSFNHFVSYDPRMKILLEKTVAKAVDDIDSTYIDKED